MAEPEDDAPGVPEWVVTYGDMMSLLLTFFIMLVSMSQLKSDSAKTRAAMDAIREVFGPTEGSSGAPGRSTQKNSDQGELASAGIRSEGGIKKAGRQSKGASGKHNAVERINTGTVITLGGPARFRRFEATLTDDLKKNLKIIAQVIRRKPHQIVIRGHATPEPLPTDEEMVATAIGAPLSLFPFPPKNRLLTISGVGIHDSFDLSFARARAVVEFLITQKIPRYRLLIHAAGHTEQRQQTHDTKGQALNRRVDVFLIDSYISRPDIDKKPSGT